MDVLRLGGLNTEAVFDSPLFGTPWWHYLTHYVLLAAVHCTPPVKKIRRLWLGPLLCHLWFSPLGKVIRDSPVCHLTHGLAMAKITLATVVLILGQPAELGYRLKMVDDDGCDKARYENFTLRKFQWAFQRCFVNFRGIGWNWEYKYVNHDMKFNDKWSFIIFKCQLYETWLKYLFYDLCATLQAMLKHKGLFANNYIMYTLTDSFTFIYIIYYALNASYYLCATLSLIFSLSEVDDWPEQFDLFKGGFSLQSFWTHWWHQYLTLDAIEINKWIYRHWRYPRIFSILVIFIINGAIHAIATFCANSAVLPWKSFMFFVLSGLNLGLESLYFCPQSIPIILQFLIISFYSSELDQAGIEYPIFNKRLTFSRFV